MSDQVFPVPAERVERALLNADGYWSDLARGPRDIP